MPSVELIDSRIVDWRIRLADTIADNASSAGVILGDERQRLAGRRVAGRDVADIDVVLYAGDQEVARGNTSAVLGDPTTAVAWLARRSRGSA